MLCRLSVGLFSLTLRFLSYCLLRFGSSHYCFRPIFAVPERFQLWPRVRTVTRGIGRVMAILTEPVQVGTSLPATPGLVLSQIDIISTASSIIQTYPSITSAYLHGSYAKGTAHPDSDIDIVIFMPDRGRGKSEDIGGVLMDLESALDRRVDLDLCPPDDFLKWIKRSRVPIHPHCGKPSDSSSDEIKGEPSM
ncbi:hypothetical protein M378DRAFT_160739 [Amanita muscaria Koide BX008]|uniref:Polymerase beta nucleotidyltransferase domain-containing protein n=1 Tax=Amanita muscaria (strain Koide BX008) TaxID=946122 RepID=A0A0C2XBH5_AMAMK|nr:hypothetical protein M378DRAFT_160739 [Amanita muscaria Koide BX008]